MQKPDEFVMSDTDREIIFGKCNFCHISLPIS